MKIVEKWVAGFWIGDLIVVKWKFQETAKKYRIVKEDCQEHEQAWTALRCLNCIPKDGDRLHDNPMDALDSLHNREMAFLRAQRRVVEDCQRRLDQIDDFELTSE